MANVTNGKPEKVKSRIAILHEAWVAGGSKRPDKKDAAALLKAFVDARQARRAAEAAFEEARKLEYGTVEAIVIRCGKGPVKIAGEVLIPMSSGTNVFFRPEGRGEVTDLG